MVLGVLRVSGHPQQIQKEATFQEKKNIPYQIRPPEIPLIGNHQPEQGIPFSMYSHRRPLDNWVRSAQFLAEIYSLCSFKKLITSSIDTAMALSFFLFFPETSLQCVKNCILFLNLFYQIGLFDIMMTTYSSTSTPFKKIFITLFPEFI